MAQKKPWGGRFRQKTSKLVEEFTASIHFDRRLYPYDIEGSLAHCRMLARQKLITKDESRLIIDGLRAIKKEIDQDQFIFTPSLEDIHMHIEKALVDKIGPAGEKLHTARSRNDQVATDVRLYLRDKVQEIIGLIKKLQQSLVGLARRYSDVIMPGYTHLQRAQPVLLAHHLLAYYEMLKRDRERFFECLKRVNVLPLGSAALAGTGLPIDRRYVAKLLDFPSISANSIDAVSDRDFAMEFLADCSILMVHLSRLSEELILWSSSEFSFIEIGDAFCTGSSIMPQKKNPDVPELVRGKAGRVFGHLLSLLTVMKALPLAYNRDMQEDKEALFDTVDTVARVLTVYSAMLGQIEIRRDKVNKAVQKGFLTATDLADYLVLREVPFREAHAIVGRIVRYCLDRGCELTDLSLDELKKFSDRIEADVFEYIRPEKSVESRVSTGGTAPGLVLAALKAAEKELK
ncbi:MAG TPA: argininosuccinate lyase [Proteobacteria bacterium]|nr:argininosuccinate lyase [Pseudomonadota bacterium]